MKVFLISTACLEVPPRTYGGLEQVVYDLSKRLAQRGHEVTVACPIGSQLPENVEMVPTIDLNTDKWNENLALLKILEDGRIMDADIIHDHSHRKSIYSSIKDHEEECHYLSTLHCPDSVLFPVLYPNLVTLSEDHRQAIFEHYGYESKVVYNGIDVDSYEFRKDKEDRFIFLGRPVEFKGALEAVQYCKKLDVGLDVVGGILEENPSLYTIRVAQECKLGSKWKYWGAVPFEIKKKLLARSKGLIFPFNRKTWREPFGLTVIEALASGTPVITWNIGVFRETLIHGKTGFLANTEEEFLEYMKRVDEIDPKDCRRDAEERWTDLRMARDYEDLYQRVLKGERW